MSSSSDVGTTTAVPGQDDANKKKRKLSDTDQDDLPQPYDAKALQPAKRRQRSTSPSATSASQAPARKLKRPGQRARIPEAERTVIRQRALEREQVRERVEAEAPASTNGALTGRNGIKDVVRAHYNSVPERGRDWRRTDSRIKGLRSFNNWVKSCLIHKFTPDEDHTPGLTGERNGSMTNKKLLVLDIGCGKGGDLGKWEQAPQPVELYVGLDPADVSIDQARQRFRGMVQRANGGGRGGGRGNDRRPPQPGQLFEARFHVKDCFGESLEDVEIVRQVGFTGASHPGMSNPHRGFDVVTMMFCMHYAFESEAKARQMLSNVAGALKKHGRFIGCIPNSHVIGEHVEVFHQQRAQKQKAQEQAATSGGDADKRDSPADAEDGIVAEDEAEEGEAEETTAHWGNSIFQVRFPGDTPPDGIFRPPFGWKYNFFLHEAVEEVPEYVVPWEAFRALAEDYNLELQYHKPFPDIWAAEKNDRVFGPLSERMGVRGRGGGPLLVSKEEMEATAFYVGFCFYRV